MSSNHHPGWSQLLTWLESHGMDASPQSLRVQARSTSAGGGYGMLALEELIPPLTSLFTVPASALLNLHTLSAHYPKTKPSLSSVQMVSLHLFLHRPVGGVSSDPLFGPYIAVLPADFDSHPLTWYLLAERNHAAPGSWLLDRLPSFVRRDLQRVARTWRSDWERIQSYLEARPKVLGTATNPGAQDVLSDPASVQDDFLWAWLNVNTRCIYYRIKEAKLDPDNLTLCPILDFANHSSVQPSVTPQASSTEIWDMPWKKKKTLEDFTLLSPAGKSTLPQEELFLRYGFHSNQLLFVEYGFAVGVSEEDVLRGEAHCDVDIAPVVEDLIVGRGKVGEWMKERLEEEGYWGEWTLHSSPAPAHPSYRLITALRLYDALPSGVQAPDDVSDLDARLDQWRATVAGERESISDENEAAWRETLRRICQTVIDCAVVQTKALAQQNSVGKIVECVLVLWDEERFVAKAVLESLVDGVAF